MRWRKPKLALILLLSITLLATLWLVGVFKTEPVYSGKPMSRWVEELGTINGGQAVDRWSQIKPKDAVPHLVQAYTRRDSALRNAYSRLYPKLPLMVKRMIPAPTQYEPIRRNAIHLLRSLMGSNAAPVIPLLVKELNSKEPQLKWEAASELGNFRKSNPASIRVYEEQAIKALTTALEDPHRSVRQNAAASLYEFGPSARTASPLLKKLATNDSEYVQCNAIVALWKIETNADFVIPLFVTILNNSNVWLKDSAVQTLAEMGPPAKAALGALKQTAQTEKPHLRLKALEAIWEIDADEHFITPLLREAFDDSSISLRTSATNLAMKMQGRKNH